MSRELQERIAELERENDILNTVCLELSLHNVDLIYENHLLWKVVTAAKKFDGFLHDNNIHYGNMEYIRFMSSLSELNRTLQEQMKLLEKQTAKPTNPPTAK